LPPIYGTPTGTAAERWGDYMDPAAFYETLPQPLSRMDGALLRYQRKNSAAPVAVAYLLRAAGTCDLDAVRAAVRDRARTFPPLTQRLTAGAGRAGRPTWTPQPGYDVSALVSEHPLPVDAGRAGLRAFIERRCQATMPLDAPPWELCLVPGPGSGEFHILFRASHIWLDGAAQHRVLGMLFGDGPPAGPGPVGPDRRDPRDETDRRDRPDGRPDPRALAVALGRVLRWATPTGGLAALSQPWSGDQIVHWETTGVERLRALGRAYGASVNDVFLVALSGALDGWSTPTHGRRPVHALMPVSIRRGQEWNQLGNYVVGARVSLRRGPAAPWSRFEAVRQQTSRYRGAGNVAAGERWWFERIPARFGAAAVTLGMDSRRVPVTTSNVGLLPGPMTVAGQPITGAVPIPVLLPGQRLFVMLGAYGATAALSLAVDGNVPAGAQLAARWLAELDRLERAAGLTTIPAQAAAVETAIAAPRR